MPRRRPLILLPPSKGKLDGGDGPAYGRTFDTDHPLAAPRRAVLGALATDVPTLRDPEIARLAGVGARDAVARGAELTTLATAATVPAHRRYTGVVHGNAGLTELRPDRVRAEVRIVSALLGLAGLAEPVPHYRLEFSASLPTLGGLAPFWRDALADHLWTLGRGRRIWDLLPGEHRRVWQPRVRAGLDVVEVSFVRPDGRAANAARTKVAKGRLAAAVIAMPELAPDDLSGAVDLGDGWTITVEGPQVRATWSDPG
ncbi:MAG: peroxide stress protein YaaA [Nitriliruptor sp.]